jgi:hypothetical protein
VGGSHQGGHEPRQERGPTGSAAAQRHGTPSAASDRVADGGHGRGSDGWGDKEEAQAAEVTKPRLHHRAAQPRRGACGACGACGARGTTQEMMDAVKAKKLAKSCNDTTTGG